MSLFRSIATIGGYTMVSRILGFLRDILIARVLGTGMAADAFFVSQRFPNLFGFDVPDPGCVRTLPLL